MVIKREDLGALQICWHRFAALRSRRNGVSIRRRVPTVPESKLHLLQCHLLLQSKILVEFWVYCGIHECCSPSLLKQNQCCLVVFDVVYVSIVRSRFVSKQEKFYPRCTPRLTGPQSRDTPPKRGYLLLLFSRACFASCAHARV